MKAIIKETGETVEGFKYMNEKGIASTFITFEGIKIPIEEVEFVTINWEQRRYEIAKAVLHEYTCPRDDRYTPNEEYAARIAVDYADALIKELKNKSRI